MYIEELNYNTIFINNLSEIKYNMVPNYIREKIIEIYIPINTIRSKSKRIISELLFELCRDTTLYNLNKIVTESNDYSNIQFPLLEMREVEYSDIRYYFDKLKFLIGDDYD